MGHSAQFTVHGAQAKVAFHGLWFFAAYRRSARRRGFDRHLDRHMMSLMCATRFRPTALKACCLLH